MGRRFASSTNVRARPYLVTRVVVATTFWIAMAEPTLAAPPDCAGPDDWPALMALAHLKSRGMSSEAQLDYSKTRVLRLASEPKGVRFIASIT